jgi:hypothetical protein
MNDFVNPYQRGFDLPEGCKDLIDVLRMVARSQPPTPDPAAPEGFADIENYIACCTKSQAKQCRLSIYCWQSVNKVLLSLFRIKGVLHALILVKCTNPFREQIVRAVFAERGIAPTQDSLAGDSDNQSRFLFYPLPTLPRDAAAIITDLIHKAYRLPEGARLEFHLHESNGS